MARKEITVGNVHLEINSDRPEDEQSAREMLEDIVRKPRQPGGDTTTERKNDPLVEVPDPLLVAASHLVGVYAAKKWADTSVARAELLIRMAEDALVSDASPDTCLHCLRAAWSEWGCRVAPLVGNGVARENELVGVAVRAITLLRQDQHYRDFAVDSSEHDFQRLIDSVVASAMMDITLNRRHLQDGGADNLTDLPF
jgi:hypothetical protein